MPNRINTETVAYGFANADEIILETTPTTRLLFRPQVHNGGVRGSFIRQKKNRSEEWEDAKAINFNQLKSGDGVKIELGTEKLEAFYRYMTELYTISRQGIGISGQEYVVSRADEVIVADANKIEVIKQLLNKGYSEDFWNTLAEENPNLATRLSWAQIYKTRNAALIEFKNSLESNGNNEAYWQTFFTNNTWIFGYGLKYQFLHLIQEQPNYGGAIVDRSGGQRGDYLTATGGENQFTVLVEIKTAHTQLLGNSEYRKGTWKIGGDLANSIAQLQINCKTWERSAREAENIDALEKQQNVFTQSPTGILIIGRTSELDSRTKKNTFHEFRNNLANPEVITFDELYARAKFIVSHHNQEDIEEISNADNEPVATEIDPADLQF